MASSPETRMDNFLPSSAQFEELSKLGEGYHGVVVKARNSVTGETVALKTLHSRPLYYANLGKKELEEELKEFNLSRRLLREACFMAACRGHPNIANLSAVGRHARTGQYFLVMENVVGPSLDDVLMDQRRGKPFPEPDVRRIMRQVLSGAKAMHDRGVVHRAINSANVLVGGGGADVFKIVDFGEATSTSESHVSYATLMSHIAPEYLLDAEGAGNSVLNDSWSLGCLMLVLLTGENHLNVELDNDRESQLYRIFDLLGVPGKKTMKAIKPQATMDLAKEVRQWRARLRRLGKKQSSRLGDLVPCEVLSDDGFQVLQGLLECNPKKRLTAAAALQLPWFADDDSPAVSVS